jgi:acetylornithine deacetylase/succinyl-diaminopimelate desuccinylase-like protein
MRRKHLLVLALVAILLALPLGAANENINYTDINKIKAEGMQHSQVMELNSWLADVYAPRLTGSPMAEKAANWVVGKLKEWGLANAKIEPWENRNGFDRGWTNDKFYMAAVSPDRFPIPGTPTGWTPGTNGLQSGEVVLVTATTPEDLAQYKGKLKGKWVMTQEMPDVPAYWDAIAKRYTPEQLQAMELATAPQPEFGVTPPGGGRQGGAPAGRQGGPAAPGAPGQQAAAGQRAGAPGAPQAPAAAGGRGGQGAANARNDFFRAEGVLGTISTAPRGHGIYTISGNRASDPATTLPAIVIPAEQYGRIGRTLAKNIPVTIEADIKNTYYPNPPVFNVVGEIPGTDKADEIVLLGGHIDTWHAATGAADNGNGVAAMMEAVRILKATGVRLRRTVRVGFWEGEEQGLLGSREYVSMHFASRKPAPAGAGAGPGGGGGGRGGAPVRLEDLDVKADYNKLSVYFNIDNGTGALRGIYLQGNDAVAPIFREWMEPFRNMGMTTVTIRNTSGTDHQSFDAVGLPGFQFIQDEVEYNAIVHHTNLDTYERLQPRDNVQMATICAAWAYLAANRDDKLPRKPLATAPPTRPTTH